MIIKNGMIFGYLPYMLFASIITGLFVGIASKFTVGKLSSIDKNVY